MASEKVTAMIEEESYNLSWLFKGGLKIKCCNHSLKYGNVFYSSKNG